MKQMFLGITLTLFVCLPASAAQPEFQGPQQPLTAAQSIGHIPQIGSAVPEFGMMARKTGFSLAALTLFFLVVTGTYKRFGQKRGTTIHADEIEVLARKPLGQRQSLLLVSVGGQRFLLAQGSEEVRLISDIDDEASFRNTLNESLALIDNPRKLANEDEA